MKLVVGIRGETEVEYRVNYQERSHAQSSEAAYSFSPMVTQPQYAEEEGNMQGNEER